jgi:hypothetical protein
MRNLPKSKIVTVLCLIALILITVMPGCSGRKITTTGELPQSLDKLYLTEMWSEVAEAADIQEPGAQLGDFRLRADENGGIDLLSFNFLGRNKEGVPCIYFADMGQKGKIDIREYEGEPESFSAHPMPVFAEIDKLGVASLEPGESGLSMEICIQGGDVGYSYDYSDIYHLEDGGLRQLEEIVFHSETPWCTIGVYKLSPLEMITTEDGQTVTQATTVAAPPPPGKRTSQIWFLSEGINRAEKVKYLETDEEAEAGRVLDVKVGLGLQSALARGVSFENAKVQAGTIEKGPVWNPRGGSKYYAGDLCLLVIGDIKNDTSENQTVSISALGYNSDWEQVAWTLSSARIVGVFESTVPPHSTGSFEVILSYADDVQFIELNAASYTDEMFEFTPSEPLPESELTRITFSKEWLLENDVEPDPGTVKITFPASWLEESPPVDAGDESIELTVPTDMLNAHNESTNPDEITVSFPVYYFDGLPAPSLP